MAKGSNQKLKLLYLRDLLLETDAEHPAKMEDLLAGLHRNGIDAERKSIYSDLEALRLYGLDVLSEKQGKNTVYYVGERTFQLAEVKTLVDSVQAAKFLSERKTMSLIKKLASLSSRHEASLLKRYVYVQDRVKSDNETIFYTVDAIHTAVEQDRKIEFLYWQYNADKKKVYRRDGRRYSVSPFALVWDDENYYLIAYDSEQSILKHYRVDKMERITVTEQEREGKAVFDKVDMAAYTRRNFSMFTGEEVEVVLRVENGLMGVLVDAFGNKVVTRKLDGEHITAHVRVAVSPQFFGWISSLGGGIAIESPDFVRIEFLKMLETVAAAQGELRR